MALPPTTNDRDYLPAEKVNPQQLANQRSAHTQSQGTAITLSRPSMGGAPVKDQGFAHGSGVSDDFKSFLEQHPDLSFDEALRRFKDEQKAKQRRKGLQFH